MAHVTGTPGASLQRIHQARLAGYITPPDRMPAEVARRDQARREGMTTVLWGAAAGAAAYTLLRRR